MHDRRPSTSIARFSSFFKSSQSDGLDKDDIINHVLKYCKKQKAEDTFEHQRNVAHLEDTFSESLDLDMSGLIPTSQYSLNHSTPIKSTPQNLTGFSLKTMCSTGTSLDKDILPRLSQLPNNISNSTKSIRSQSEPAHQPLITQKHSASMNTSNQSSSSCSTQTTVIQNQSQVQPPFPMYGYPIIFQVQCPHHQAFPLPPSGHGQGQCNNNHGCNNTQGSTHFNPWMQMPMMPSMTYPQFPHQSMQSAQQCANCQCNPVTGTATRSNNDQTLAIESSKSSSTKEVEDHVEEIKFAHPRRGLPKIHIDKPIIRWAATDTHVGEYTSLTIVNQCESTIFLRCGIISSPESKHFKVSPYFELTFHISVMFHNFLRNSKA